ncbi:unnamed protein product [Vicia faba]|uniref:Uncharacterized protein n=1 Tax=Vicia faba TaxID=3906 RepID=A0AAV0YKD0_VICFA|nr:unnamed protein product [Vicia faba]
MGSLPFVYLGLLIRGDSWILSLWNLVLETIKKRLSGWKSRNLSLGGWLILIKSVLSSISVYFHSFFKAPACIISSLESLINAFFWGGKEDRRKIVWIDLDFICLSKESGGLGVKRLREFNVNLLRKWCWRMLEERGSL